MDDDAPLNAPTPANDNPDPLATASSALDWLYGLRRELLAMDPATMSLDHCRRRDTFLTRFPEVEQVLLAEL